MKLSPFGSIPVPKKGRTNFDLSHSLSGTFPMANCIPVFMTQDVIPGDLFRIKVHNLTKLETLIAPAMQQVNASLLWFKVPKRLLFNRFKDWYSGGPDGQTDAEKPHWDLREIIQSLQSWTVTPGSQDALSYTSQVFGPGTLWNYFGLPCPLEYDSGIHVWNVYSSTDLSVDSLSDEDAWIDAMPFIAYWLIHDEYFMDQTLGKRMFTTEGDLKMSDYSVSYYHANGNFETAYESEDEAVGNGGKLSADSFFVLNSMFKRAWQKEYFTSALPTPQRGPEVKLNMFEGAKAPVTIDDDSASLESPIIIDSEHNTVEGSLSAVSTSTHAGKMQYDDGETYGDITDIRGTLSASGTADLSTLSPITIVAFRNLFKLQAFLEKNNVSGGRFIETILAHWAERVPDFTVQRPVHIRSTSIPVQISEVTAMANSAGLNSQLGDQAGRGKAMGNLGSLSIYCQEPSVIMALYCVTVPPAYASQGIERQWQRITRFDEPWRDFQHIGEQAIKSRELFLDWTDAVADYNHSDFGYQQRFSEFKYMPNRIVGDFQTSLSYWTMARMFAENPELNEDFVTCQPDERIFAVQNFRPITADFYFSIKAKRKLSRFSTPKLT